MIRTDQNPQDSALRLLQNFSWGFVSRILHLSVIAKLAGLNIEYVRG